VENKTTVNVTNRDASHCIYNHSQNLVNYRLKDASHNIPTGALFFLQWQKTNNNSKHNKKAAQIFLKWIPSSYFISFIYSSINLKMCAVRKKGWCIMPTDLWKYIKAFITNRHSAVLFTIHYWTHFLVVSWIMTPCRFNGYQYFKGTCCLHL
jgi:hypothetical protein